MNEQASVWFRDRTSRWQDWPVEDSLRLKEQQALRVSVVIPAHNEEATVGEVVRTLRAELLSAVPLVDEIVVIDSDSEDQTAAVAARAGARVHRARDIAPDLGTYAGKGEALWKSLLVTVGDILVFVDADLAMWGPHFVSGLLGPLLADPQTLLVKGFYERVRTETDGSTSSEGGRVTELLARPILNLWWPDLAGVVQPLAGEWAARRALMESLSVPVGYGVELAALLDTSSNFGLHSIAQVDLGTRAHRHQAVHDLAIMSAELLVVAAKRRATGGPTPPTEATLQQFARSKSGVRPVPRTVPTYERPAIGQLRDRRTGTRP